LAYGDTLPMFSSVPPEAAQSPASLVRAPLPRVGERRRPPDAAERFGILLHALLERRTGGQETEGWWKELGYNDGEYGRVLPVAERLLAAGSLQRFFDPAQYRRAWNEVELTSGEGELQRIDRLVELDSAFWVLDYKSSGSDSARLADYQAQVAAYCRAVSGVFPGSQVRGALIFSDASFLEVC